VRLDQTRIAIRERRMLEIMDLALRVVGASGPRLLAATAVLALPLMLLNTWLIGWMVDEEYGAASIARFVWTMTQLVAVQAPLGSLVATYCLGQVMFLHAPSAGQTASDILRLLPRLAVCHLLYRGVLPVMLLAAFISPDGDFSPAELLLPLLVFCLLPLRAVRPFLNEIVLLERNPLRARDPQTLTVRRRSAALHGPNAGDLVAAWLASAAIATLLVIAVTFSSWYLAGTLLNNWSWGPAMVYLGIPLAMWLVATYFTVVRFLCYLDLRIRREGWEVELMVRAAATTLAGQET